jgi:LemA protein
VAGGSGATLNLGDAWTAGAERSQQTIGAELASFDVAQEAPSKVEGLGPDARTREDRIMFIFALLLLVPVLIILWVIAVYNRLVGLKNQTLNGWRQIDVQLKRRHDLIPNLVNTVKGVMEFERDTLTQVVEARAKAQGASGPADAARKEGELSQALGRLFALVENYPALHSNENVKALQEELSSTENKIGFARQFYNDIATKYNIGQQTFPANLIASSFGFKPAELFEVTDEAERAVPTVDLSMRK